MAKFYPRLLLAILILTLSLSSFSQVKYPCGVYTLNMNGTTNYGFWTNVYPTNDYTLAAWVRTVDTVWQGKEMDIFQRQVRGLGNDDGLDLYLSTTGEFKFRAYTFKNGVPTLDSMGSGFKPDVNTWHHVAVTFVSSGNCSIYIDGKLANSKSFGGAMSLNYPYNNYLAIGSKISFIGINNPTIPTFKGFIDELACASAALTQAQIVKLANGLSKGDAFLADNHVDSYDKLDTYPGTLNSGVGTGTVGIAGTLYICPATIDYTITDPNPAMVNDSVLSTDLSKLPLTKAVSGAATDGVTKLLLTASTAVPVTFTLSDPKDGSLLSLNDQKTLSTQLTVTPQNGKAVCVYEVPDGIGNGGSVRSVKVNVVYSGDKSHSTDIPIKLVSPPVVLVHGMWSSPAVWMEGGFITKLVSNGFHYVLANYEKDNATTFDPYSPASLPGRTAVQYAVQQALDRAHQDGIAAAQVDVVGHSLGGLMSRSLSQQPAFVNPTNYKKGYFHKLITIGTPHRGSPFGPELIQSQNNIVLVTDDANGIDPTYQTLRVADILKLANKPIGQCHVDFGSESNGIHNLEQTPPFYAYAITANYQGFLNATEQTKGYLAMTLLCSTLLNDPYTKIFQSTCSIAEVDHDLIVPLTSQQGYTNANSDTLFYGTGHSGPAKVTETNNPLIQDKVISLLLSNDIGQFNAGFPAPSKFSPGCGIPKEPVPTTSFAPKAKTGGPVVLGEVGTHLVKIGSPLSGARFQQSSDTTITMSYNVLGGAIIQSALFMIANNDMVPVDDLAARSAQYTLPKNTSIGSLTVVLIARDADGHILADTGHIIIDPAGRLDSLSCDPASLRLDSSTREAGLSVTGYFDSSGQITTGPITRASTGTVYSVLKGGIVSVSADGLVSAVKPGIDTIIVNNAGRTAKVPVVVDSNFASRQLIDNTIQFSSIPDKLTTDQAFAINASATSGEDVVFTLVSGPVQLQNGIVDINGPGEVSISASSPGNSYFKTPTTVTRTFKIVPPSLPLSLLDFTGLLSADNSVALAWKTSDEINFDHFVVERSVNGGDFSSLASVAGKGTQGLTASYNCKDGYPASGNNLYRLKMVDKDGAFSYSNIITIKFDANAGKIILYPNPAQDRIDIKIGESLTNNNTSVRITDAAGRVIKALVVSLNGSNVISLNISDLPAGMYFLYLKNSSFTSYSKFVKQ